MFRVGFVLLVCMLTYCTAKWCCGDVDTKVEAKLISVKKSRTIQVYQTEYYKLRTGYKPCPNDTSNRVVAPEGLDHNSKDTQENRNRLFDFLQANMGKLQRGEFGSDSGLGIPDSPWCPVYTTKSRVVVAYKTEMYDSAAWDDSVPSCIESKRVCCRGYKQVGDNCVEEKKAGKAAANLDFLASLGIIG